MTLTRIGLLGGMSWESTAVYYRQLNEIVHRTVGGHASAPLLVWSADFAEIETLQRADDWAAQGEILASAAQALQSAGAEAIALATNTLHLVAGAITDRIDVPFVDLIDVVGQAAADAGHRRVGVLATGYTMNSDLYQSRLAKFGVDVVMPDPADRAEVHRVIFDELVHGVATDRSRIRYLEVVDRLAAAGADAVVLGCTEIELLIADGDGCVPLLDSTRLHCQALAEIIISGVRS